MKGYRRSLGNAQAILDIARFLIIFEMMLKADFSVIDSPLPRIREQKPAVGERREVVARVYYGRPPAKVLACFTSLLLPTFGAKFEFLPKDGPIPNAEVDFEGKYGFPKHHDVETFINTYGRGPTNETPFVDFTGRSPIEIPTGPDGTATVIVQGLGQDRVIPIDSPRKGRQATVRLGIVLPKHSFWRNAYDFFKPLVSFRPNDKIKFVLEMASRMKWWKLDDDIVEVRDWGSAEYKFGFARFRGLLRDDEFSAYEEIIHEGRVCDYEEPGEVLRSRIVLWRFTRTVLYDPFHLPPITGIAMVPVDKNGSIPAQIRQGIVVQPTVMGNQSIAFSWEIGQGGPPAQLALEPTEDCENFLNQYVGQPYMSTGPRPKPPIVPEGPEIRMPFRPPL
jgi:hypothetical protein